LVKFYYFFVADNKNLVINIKKTLVAMERTFFIKALAIVAAVCCALSADAFQFQKDG